MAKKKAKKVKKTKKKLKKKKVLRKKKKTAAKKRIKKVKVREKTKGEKVVAKVDHFFGKILVAAFKLKAPLKVGDVIHIKGHTTDFTQKVDSMQIEHQSVAKANKGAEVGIRVKAKVRAGDTIYLATGEEAPIQKPMFPLNLFQKSNPASVPEAKASAKKPEKPKFYGSTRFLKF